MFIELHFVGESPTQMPLWTREPQQQGFIYNYKDVLFFINDKVKKL
jgi:hypothetical protein